MVQDVKAVYVHVKGVARRQELEVRLDALDDTRRVKLEALSGAQILDKLLAHGLLSPFARWCLLLRGVMLLLLWLLKA